jgi:hypothetical protein
VGVGTEVTPSAFAEIRNDPTLAAHRLGEQARSRRQDLLFEIVIGIEGVTEIAIGIAGVMEIEIVTEAVGGEAIAIGMNGLGVI